MQAPLIQLKVSCKDLVKADGIAIRDPQVIMYEKTKSSKGLEEWREKGRTEIAETSSCPTFENLINTPYIFGSEQVFKFGVIDVVDSCGTQLAIGQAEFTMSKLIGAKSRTMKLPLMDPENSAIELKSSLTVTANEHINSRTNLNFQFAAQLSTTKKAIKNCLYFTISRHSIVGEKLQVYRSPMLRNTTQPTWPLFDISLDTLCGQNATTKLTIELCNNVKKSENEVLGSFSSTLNQLSNLQFGSDFEIKSSATATDSIIGILTVKSFEKSIKPTFLDYISAGTTVEFSIGIDFNGDHMNPNNLHFCTPNQLNEYQKAISAIGEVLEQYDTDKCFPVFGFGGFPLLPKNPNENSSCFSLSGEEDCIGYKEVLTAYEYAKESMNSSKSHKDFCPVVDLITEEIALQKMHIGLVYHVLVILTDGVISNMKSTVDSIIESAKSPLSVLIVGVGSSTFENLFQLSSTANGLLTTANGKKTAIRDNVHTVPLYMCETVEQLNKQFMSQIPNQMVEYMMLNSITPEMVVEALEVSNWLKGSKENINHVKSGENGQVATKRFNGGNSSLRTSTTGEGNTSTRLERRLSSIGMIPPNVLEAASSSARPSQSGRRMSLVMSKSVDYDQIPSENTATETNSDSESVGSIGMDRERSESAGSEKPLSASARVAAANAVLKNAVKKKVNLRSMLIPLSSRNKSVGDGQSTNELVSSSLNSSTNSGGTITPPRQNSISDSKKLGKVLGNSSLKTESKANTNNTTTPSNNSGTSSGATTIPRKALATAIKISKGSTRNGLFKYELHYPKQITVERPEFHLQLRIEYTDILPFEQMTLNELSIELLEARLHKEDISSSNTTTKGIIDSNSEMVMSPTTETPENNTLDTLPPLPTKLDTTTTTSELQQTKLQAGGTNQVSRKEEKVVYCSKYREYLQQTIDARLEQGGDTTHLTERISHLFKKPQTSEEIIMVSFTLKTKDAVPDLTMETMEIQHFLNVKVDYTLSSSEAILGQSIQIPLKVLEDY